MLLMLSSQVSSIGGVDAEKGKKSNMEFGVGVSTPGVIIGPGGEMVLISGEDELAPTCGAKS